MDDLTTTSDVSAGGDTGTALATTGSTAPAAPQSSDLTTAVAEPVGGTAAPAAWESIIQAIPDDDTDLQQPTFQHVQGLQEQRKQLRVLRDALKEYKPLQSQLAAYQELGEPTAIKPAVELANLLYSEAVDQYGRPLIDPGTQTSYVTTVPFLQYLDENSPGMPEQLLVDLLAFRPTDENGQPTDELWKQIMRSWKLDPARMDQYRNLDSLLTTSTGAITREELADVPAEYHDAYRRLLPSVRNAWAAYSEADQLALLQREKDTLDRIARDNARDARDQQREQVEQQRAQALISHKQAEYLDTVRRERLASIAEPLSQRITFSTDPATNAVMHGAVGAVMANLIDPELRFVSEPLLKALNIKLDHTFDEALTAFGVHAANKVAQELQGDVVRANQSEEKANAAANLLTTKLATIALQVAKAMGGQQAAAAATQGAALATATTSRPATPSGGAGADPTGVLPPGVRPGSAEAALWLAKSTGFLREVV